MGAKYGNSVTSEIRLPVLLVGFGVFLPFQQRAFYSRAINSSACGAFAVCLITEYPSARDALWRGALDLGCAALDLVRRRVFGATVDPLWDRWFEVLYGKARVATGWRGRGSDGVTARLRVCVGS